MTLHQNPKWIDLHTLIWRHYQKYRRIRIYCLNIEQQRWSPHLQHRIITEFVPLITELLADPDLHNTMHIQKKWRELDEARITEKYS